MLLYDYGGYGVMEAPNSVKVVARDRYPLVTPRLCLFSLKVEHPPYKWDTAERYRQEVPVFCIDQG